MRLNEKKMKRIKNVVIVLTSLLLLVLLVDGYAMSQLNMSRLKNHKWPILTYDSPHDGMGSFHYGITYKITTGPGMIEFRSKMPFVKNKVVARNNIRTGDIKTHN